MSKQAAAKGDKDDMPIKVRFLVAMLAGVAAAGPAAALTPEEVLVVANTKMPESVSLAETYAELRSIPAENVVIGSSARSPNPTSERRCIRASRDESLPVTRATSWRFSNAVIAS